MGRKRAVGEVVATLADGAGALQQAFEAGGKDRVAVVDGVLSIANEVGEADLVLLGMAGLCGKAVRDPHLGPSACQEASDHGLAAARSNNVPNGCRTAEHPLPVGFSLDPRRGLVASDDGGGAHIGLDGLASGRERHGGPRQHVGDGALRQRQAKQPAQHLDKPVETDHLAGMQINDKCNDAGAERASWRHVGRRRGGDALAAAGAGATMQIDPCRDGLDRRQVDMIVGGDVRLAGLCEPGAATGAGLGVDIAHNVRIGVQSSRNAWTTFARRLGRIGPIGLLAGRGWC